MSIQRTARVPRYVFDSSLFISYITDEVAGSVTRGRDVLHLLKEAEEGKLEILFSYAALPEILKEGSQTAAGTPITQEGINRFFEREEIQMISVERLIAEKAREVRRDGPVRMSVVDAILVATAIIHKADALFTYDQEHLIAYDGMWEGLRICEPFLTGQARLPIN